MLVFFEAYFSLTPVVPYIAEDFNGAADALPCDKLSLFLSLVPQLGCCQPNPHACIVGGDQLLLLHIFWLFLVWNHASLQNYTLSNSDFYSSFIYSAGANILMSSLFL